MSKRVEIWPVEQLCAVFFLQPEAEASMNGMDRLIGDWRESIITPETDVFFGYILLTTYHPLRGIPLYTVLVPLPTLRIASTTRCI